MRYFLSTSDGWPDQFKTGIESPLTFYKGLPLQNIQYSTGDCSGIIIDNRQGVWYERGESQYNRSWVCFTFSG